MRKRRWSAALCLCMALSCIPVSAFAADTDSAIEITTAEQLKQLADEVNAGDSKLGKTYILQNDIDLSAYTDGAGWTPIGDYTNPFSGVFDGQGHTITNLKIANPKGEYIGLFGHVEGRIDQANAQVKNIKIDKPDIIGYYHVGAVVGYYDESTDTLSGCAMLGGKIDCRYDDGGGIAGRNYNAQIADCYSTGDISGRVDDIGGIVGDNSGDIINCYATGTVSGRDDDVGGIVGDNDNGNITNCYATGTVSGRDDNIGGIIGSNEDGNVINCYMIGVVNSGDNDAGGIVGENYGEADITGCYFAGTVNSTGYNIGGIVGSNYESGNIVNCYTEGTVRSEGDRVGGIVGDHNDSGNIVNCYSTAEISSEGEYIGGIAGRHIFGDANKGTIQNCAALNESVTSETDTVYRIAANDNGILSNNYAWSGMTVNGKTVTDGAADQEHGADLTCTDGKLSKQFSELFNNDEAWNFADNKLPTLKNINAEQEGILPDWLHTHSYTEVVTEPTCTEKGYTTYTCVCGESHVDNYTDALGHDYQNGVCTRCSEKDPNYKPDDKPTTKPVEEVFSDVKPNDWFYPEVQYVYDNELMNGTDLGFEPNTVLTRSMMMTILWRMDGKPAPSGTTSFTDVKSGEWYVDAVAWAQENNISNGYGDGTFGTFDSITREQMVTMFHRYAQYKGYDVSASADLSAYSDAGRISNYASVPMKWAVGCGLMKGRTETTLEPQGTATRAEAATIMHRFDTIVKK